MPPPPRGQVRAARTTDRPPFTTTVSSTTHRPHGSSRRCGCDTHRAAEDVGAGPARPQPLSARRTVSRLLHETLWAAAAGAAYTCGASGAGTILYWLIHR